MTMTEEQAKETWSKLEAAIAMIHKQNASSLSFEELYRYAYNMVLHRHAAMLYAGMESSLRSHLQGIVQELQTYTDMAFMRQLLLKWINYHKSTQLIRDILMVRPTCHCVHYYKLVYAFPCSTTHLRERLRVAHVQLPVLHTPASLSQRAQRNGCACALFVHACRQMHWCR